MNQNISTLHELHKKSQPLFLFNVWDAGTAKIAVDSGSDVIATSSWSVAEAQGYTDGQIMPFDDLLTIVKNIVRAVNVPVTVDFESGYSEKIETVCENFSALINIGVSGINFEDQDITNGGIFGIEEQSARILSLRNVARNLGVNIFINARTDVFLQESDQEKHKDLLEDAILRGRAYSEAGASGFFIPGTTDKALIKKICDSVNLPVNVMDMSDKPDVDGYGKSGVSRVSIGPKSWIDFSQDFKQKVKTLIKK